MLGAWFYHILVNTMLLLLLSPSDNCSVHGFIKYWLVPFSDCCYYLLTMLGAWFDQELVSTMLWLLSSPTDNARSMVYQIFVNTMLWLLLSPTDDVRGMAVTSIDMNHAHAVVITY